MIDATTTIQYHLNNKQRYTQIDRHAFPMTGMGCHLSSFLTELELEVEAEVEECWKGCWMVGIKSQA